ncbi:MAG: hypothetical protein K5929_08575 [Lachnospiraceae bacterium]|nr:hypothetical protein [Lachnospiraceae bacterium]
MKPNGVKAEFSDIGYGIILTKSSRRHRLSLDVVVEMIKGHFKLPDGRIR